MRSNLLFMRSGYQSDSTLRWSPPIKDEQLKKEAEDKLHKIASIIMEKCSYESSLGFMKGLGGPIVFMHYYDEHFKSDFFRDAIAEQFDRFHSLLIDNSIRSLSLCEGLAGFLWTNNLLSQLGLVDLNSFNHLNKYENYCKADLLRKLQDGNLDYLYGASIIFNSHFNNSLHRDALIDILSMHVKKSGFGFNYIQTSVDKLERPSDYVDLGIAHGASGLIICLCKYYISTLNPKVKQLLEDLIEVYFFANSKNSSGKSFFPYGISTKGEISFDSRLAWCTGDLAVTVALINFNRIFNNKQVHNLTSDLIRACLKRRNNGETGVVDGGFCHGSAGILHIFGRLYNEFNLPELQEASQFWLKDLLKKGNNNNGFAGYQSYQKDGYTNSLDVISGVSGIGLSIIAAISDVDPVWDKCFLLD